MTPTQRKEAAVITFSDLHEPAQGGNTTVWAWNTPDVGGSL